MIAEVKRRLEAIDIDGFTSAGDLEQYLADRPRNIFPRLMHTERPDRFARALLQGRVGLLVDGLPVGFLLPGTLPEMLRVSEDRARHAVVASALLLIRWAAMAAGLLLPALSERVRRAGGLVFWAHPFRVRDYIPDPSAQLDAALLDGVEAENYCDPDEVNEGAWRFAAAHDLPVSAGSDNYRGLEALQNGLAVPEPLYTADDLKAALRKRDKTLLVRGWERETAERDARA